MCWQGKIKEHNHGAGCFDSALKAVRFFSIGCDCRTRFFSCHGLVCPQDGTELDKRPDAFANVVKGQDGAKGEQRNVGLGQYLAGFGNVGRKGNVNHKFWQVFEDGHCEFDTLAGLELLDQGFVRPLNVVVNVCTQVFLVMVQDRST